MDIGGADAKVVMLTPHGNNLKLVGFGKVSVPPGSSMSENHADQERLAETIRKLLQDAGISSRNVAVALPESQVFTRVIETPVLSEAELESAIKWEAEQYVPVPLNEVLLRHQILSVPEKNVLGAKMDVLLVAAPHAVVNRYMNILKLAGLQVLAIETEIFAISRALVGADPYSPTTLIVNLGATTTDLSVVKKGNLAFVRSIATGGEAIARAVSADLNIDISQAEEYKRAYGLDPDKLDGKVVTAIKPIVEVIVTEIKRAMVYYQTKKPDDPVRRMVLSGGMAQMPGLVNFLGESLTLEVQVGNPVANIMKNDQQAKAMLDDAPIYSAAVGLAMKEA